MNHASTKLIPTEEERQALYKALRAWTGNPTIADDLVQQTLLEAWKSNRQPAPEEWRPWLFGIARNVLMRWRRELSVDLRRTIAAPQSESVLAAASLDGDIDVELEQQEIISLLHDMLEALPTETREILLLKYIHELPQAEIAKALDMNEKALEGRLHRGKKKLRTHLLTHRPDTALSLGVVTEPNTWQSTNIWCYSCGQARLEARWYEDGTLRFDCPRCQNGWFRTGERINQTTQHFTGGIPANPPSFAKVHQMIAQHAGAMLHYSTASPRQCPLCHGPIEPRRWQPAVSESSTLDPEIHLDVVYSCDTCQSIASFTFLPGTGIWSEHGLAFVSRHPQVNMQKPVATEWQGRSAVRQTWKSLNAPGEFTCWIDTESFILMDIMVDGELQ